MKRKFLKWDLIVQTALMAVNSLLLVIIIFAPAFLYVLLPWQVLVGFYQLISNGLYLRFCHKSTGYIKFRLIHFFGSLIYLFLLQLSCTYVHCEALLWGMAFIIPHCVFYAYLALCYYELRQLQKDEFQILQ